MRLRYCFMELIPETVTLIIKAKSKNWFCSLIKCWTEGTEILALFPLESWSRKNIRNSHSLWRHEHHNQSINYLLKILYSNHYFPWLIQLILIICGFGFHEFAYLLKILLVAQNQYSQHFCGC